MGQPRRREPGHPSGSEMADNGDVQSHEERLDLADRDLNSCELKEENRELR